MASKLNTIRQYLDLKTSISQLEEKLKNLKPKVESILSEEVEHKLSVDDAILCLSSVKREVFDLKEARSKLGEKIIKPFLKPTEYSQIRVTYKRVEAA